MKQLYLDQAYYQSVEMQSLEAADDITHDRLVWAWNEHVLKQKTPHWRTWLGFIYVYCHLPYDFRHGEN
jgi:hypothetical protein